MTHDGGRKRNHEKNPDTPCGTDEIRKTRTSED